MPRADDLAYRNIAFLLGRRRPGSVVRLRHRRADLGRIVTACQDAGFRAAAFHGQDSHIWVVRGRPIKREEG